MEENDTVQLLNECSAGIKMAVRSIDEVVPKIENEKFRHTLSLCKQHHEQLGEETHRMLNRYRDEGKEPGAVAKGMSWMKTNVTMAVKHSDHTAADLLTNGCNIGVKTLNRHLNEFPSASEDAKNITKQLIHLEDQLSLDLRSFL